MTRFKEETARIQRQTAAIRELRQDLEQGLSEDEEIELQIDFALEVAAGLHK